MSKISDIKKGDLPEYYIPENYFKNKKGLRGEDVELRIIEEQIEEVKKCAKDINYFLENYVKVVHPDYGKIFFKPREFQKELYELITENSNVMSMVARQSGKSVGIGGYVLWFVSFHPDKIVDIVSNKESSAKKLLKKIKDMYRELPMFLQSGVVEWNKTSIELDNGCKVMVEATTEDAGTGDTVNLFICDEFAKVPKNIADDFMKSVLPTLSAGKSQKLVIITTPKGMNFFYRLWKKEQNSKNPEYVQYVKDWTANPERDEEWKKSEIRKLGKSGFAQEYECVSGDTIVTVKEEYTDFERKLRIDELYELMAYNNFRVMTPSGYQKFYGVNKEIKNKYRILHFEDGSELKCSFNHVIITHDNREVKAGEIVEGMFLKSFDGKLEITNIDTVKEEIELYDLISVDDKNVYYTNNVVSHNCSFLGSSKSLIDSDTLNEMDFGEVIELHPYNHIDDLNIYELPITGVKYIITADCAEGLGDTKEDADSSCFSVLKIMPDMSFIQIATFDSKRVDEVMYAEILNEIGIFYNDAFILVECNSMGGQVLDNLQYREEYENVIDLNADRYIAGLKATSATNLTGNRALKKMIKKGYLQIHDGLTVEQLSNYVKKGGNKYEGIDNEHDDNVTALRNFCYLLTCDEWTQLDDSFKSYSDILKIDMKRKKKKIKKKESNEDEDFFFVIK